MGTDEWTLYTNKSVLIHEFKSDYKTKQSAQCKDNIRYQPTDVIHAVYVPLRTRAYKNVASAFHDTPKSLTQTFLLLAFKNIAKQKSRAPGSLYFGSFTTFQRRERSLLWEGVFPILCL